MSGKIVEGVWDCPYCGADEIGGLQKYCPSCGHPQSQNTKFRMGTAKRYLTEEEINTVGTEPDWLCDYCNTLNNDKFKYCKNCGAERTKENKDYFEMHQEGNAARSDDESSDPEAPEVNQSTYRQSKTLISQTHTNRDTTERMLEQMRSPKKSINWAKAGKYIGISVIIALVIAGLAFIFAAREYGAVVTEKTWERAVVIQEYKTVEESAWDRVPSGGRLLYSKQEIKSYDQVLDHYETKTRQVAKQVFDGYDTHTYYTDNGNGTFTEHTSQTPRYRTEYVTETYQEPVYKTVPVYGTKYYYEIERWVYDRTEKSKGSNNNPYWPEYTLSKNERVDSKKESYFLHLFVDDEEKKYTYNCSSKDEYDSYAINDEVLITVSAGIVIEIELKE